MAETPEVSTGLVPELLVIIDYIYRDMCNLQPGTNVLIITDSRTPRHIVSAFMGVAMTMGAEVSVSENRIPAPPTLQPGYKWNSMVKAASREADLIIDMAVGYADFIADAVERGARVMCPGDGNGSFHLEDTLIRTMMTTDLDAMRRESIEISQRFTEATTLRMTSEEGTDFEMFIGDLEGADGDEYLWDPDKKDWTATSWVTLPPAGPGIVLPKGRGDGILAVDGTLLYEPAYDHERPTGPVFLTLEKGKIVDVQGEPLFAGRLRNWLGEQDDDSANYGPVHLNLGLNPRAMMTQHQEFEKLRGTIVCGFGDSSLMARMWHGSELEPNVSHIHWDIILMRPTLQLDDLTIIKNGIMVDPSKRTEAA